MQSGTLTALLHILETRFGTLPPPLAAHLTLLSAEQLSSLLRPALTAPDIESFAETAMEMQPKVRLAAAGV